MMSWTCSIRSRAVSSPLAAARLHHHYHHDCRNYYLSALVECPDRGGLSRRKRATAPPAASSSLLPLLRFGVCADPYYYSTSIALYNSLLISINNESSSSSLCNLWNNSMHRNSLLSSNYHHNRRRRRHPNNHHRYYSHQSSSSPSSSHHHGLANISSSKSSSSDNTIIINNQDEVECNTSGGEKKNDCNSSSMTNSNLTNTTNNNNNENTNNVTLYSILPTTLHPYARLSRIDKPIGTFLLLHPCLWSVALASSSSSSSSTTTIPSSTMDTFSSSIIPLLLDDSIASNNNNNDMITTSTANLFQQLLIDHGSNSNTFHNNTFLSICTTFALGSFIMRSAGCTINDMWDASYDKSVERTKSRPLACGEVTHAQAAKFLVLQLVCGLGVLVSLPHVEECVLWGLASMPLVVAYPLMKRYTNFPQVVLGMTFNWGAILGWVAVRGGGGEHIDWTVVGPLYVAGIAWTVVYDTLYAHQDKKDDEKLGLKSTALTFGDSWTKPILTGCTAITWGGWMMAGYNCGFGTEDNIVALSALFDHDSAITATTIAAVAAQNAYYVGVSAAATHMLWQIYTADLNDANNLAHRFKSNNLVGWIVFASCCVAAGGSNVVLAAG